MRRVSKKRRKLISHNKLARQEYLKDHPVCMLGCGRIAENVHEIARGSFRQHAYAAPATWLAVCVQCNVGPLTNAYEWPLERQLALKYMRDKENFDLVKLNQIRAGAGRMVYWEDITPFLEEFQ